MKTYVLLSITENTWQLWGYKCTSSVYVAVESLGMAWHRQNVCLSVGFSKCSMLQVITNIVRNLRSSNTNNCTIYQFVKSFNFTLKYTNIFFISVINQLDAQNFCFPISLFHASTCFEHHVLIIRRSKLHYTASGIIKPIGVMIPEAV